MSFIRVCAIVLLGLAFCPVAAASMCDWWPLWPCEERAPAAAPQPRALELELRLTHIDVLDEGDGSGPAAPYLWPVMFKVDADALAFFKSPSGRWIHAPGGAHGNLGKGYYARDRIDVSPALGAWRTTLREDALVDASQSLAGMVLVLLEEDDLPSSADVRDKYYPEFVSEVTRTLQCAIKGNMSGIVRAAHDLFVPVMCPTKSASPSSGSDFKAIEKEITAELTRQLNPFASIVADFDDFVGVSVLVWRWADLERDRRQSFDVTWARDSEDGSYRAYGMVSARRLDARDTPASITVFGGSNRIMEDPRVQRALVLAFPSREALSKYVFGGQPVDLSIDWYPVGDAGWLPYTTGLERQRTSKAKELLAQSGSLGFDLKLFFEPNDGALLKLAQLIQAGFRRLGINTDLVAHGVTSRNDIDALLRGGEPRLVLARTP